MKKFITFCLIAFALLPRVKAQIFDLRISKELQNASIIISLAQDHQGYIWIGSTAGGLIRYDGSKLIFITNNPQDPNSLASNWVEKILIDSNDIIWLGTRAGLDRYDRSNNTFTHYRHNIKDNGSLSNDTVTALIQDRDGNIWVGTRKGLNTFNAQTGKFTHYYNKVNDPASLSYNDVNILYEDRQGILWVGCGSPFYEHEGKPEDGGLNRFDKQTGKFKRYIHDPSNPNSIENNKVRSMLEDSKGNFWIGTAGDGLHTLDRATGIFTHYHYDSAHPESLSRPPVQNHPWGLDHITFIHEDAKGLVWIGTLAGGINEYNPVTKKVTHYGFIATPPDKIIKADTLSGFKNFQPWNAFTSKDGLLWISAVGEVYTLNTNRKSIIPYFKTKQRNVNAFYEEKNGSLWIGTDTGLIHKDISGKEEIFLKNPLDKHGLNNNTVTSIQPDNEGKLWLATFGGGINKFDPLTQTFTHYVHDAKRNSLSDNYVNNLLFDHTGTLWAATDSGLNRLDNQSGLFTVYTHNAKDSNSLGENAIFCLLDGGDYWWLGTNSGVERLNKTNGKFTHYLQKNKIRSLFVDKDGILWTGAWLGPSDGLYYYDKVNDRFIFYTAADGNIKINRVGSIIGDNQNNLWVSTYNAIYKISSDRNSVTIHGNEYGVHTDSFAYATNYKTKNGKLLLGDQHGYYAFFPEQITASTSPQIYITNFQLGDKEVVPGKGSALSEPLYKANEITLQYNQSSFSIALRVTHYTSPGEVKYWYKLENYDTIWHDGVNKAYFFNLSPGDYIFHVKAMNSDGVWSEKKLSVIISPPWWLTWWVLTLLALAVITITWTFYYYRSRKLRKENQLLEEKVNHRTVQLQRSLEELKSTQAQLIHSEKMASLGELTAGIAHEIQNPLNFVNNFSEVNKELIEELQEELKAGKIGDAIIISNDIKENEGKINHHGRRADAIVKNMLQHSISSSSQKEPTNINALADEYLRLSYHGLRAKDKTLKATLQTDFDTSIGKITIVPQEIGRVLLNIYNNAFYAVVEKKKHQPDSYEPTVSLSTKKIRDKVEIKVKDNGNGISQKILDKIFQPFFTTKPTGQGTGLGLSLSYDIIKAHGGEIIADSSEHEFAEFVILLPITA